MFNAIARVSTAVPRSLGLVTATDLQALDKALQERNDDAVLSLLSDNPAIARYRYDTGESVLHRLLKHCCGEAVLSAALDAGAPSDAAANNGTTVLMEAADQGNSNAIRLLLRMGAGTAVDRQDQHGESALRKAIRKQHREAVEALLEGGASPNAIHYAGTILRNAIMQGSPEIVHALLKHGATAGGPGVTPLMVAAEVGAPPIVQSLACGAGLNARDQKGRTALMHAALHGRVAQIQILLRAGADVEAKDYSGCTALMLACTTANAGPALQALLQGGARVDTRDFNGSTALIQAAAEKHWEAVEVLIEAGAVIAAVDRFGNSALLLACQSLHHAGRLPGPPGPPPRSADPSFLAAQQRTAQTLQIAYLIQGKAFSERELKAIADSRVRLPPLAGTLKRLAVEQAAWRQAIDPLRAALEAEKAAKAELALHNARLTEALERSQAELGELRIALADARARLPTVEGGDPRDGAPDQAEPPPRSIEQRLDELKSLRREQDCRIADSVRRLREWAGELSQTQHKLTQKLDEVGILSAQLTGSDQGAGQDPAMAAQLRELERERDALQLERDTLAHQHENLRIRVELLQQERDRLIAIVPQADTLPAEQARLCQLQAALDERKRVVSGQAASPAQQQELKLLAEQEQRLRDQVDRLDKQLRVFESIATTPRERVFGQFLKDLSRHAELRGDLPRLFISYAWEDIGTPEGRARNQALQEKLLYLQRQIEKLGCVLFLDVRDMSGNLNHHMRSELADSRYVLLIGTERLKQRVEQERGSNVAFEFRHIMDKSVREPRSLIPLLLEGDHKSAFPDGVTENLVHDFRDRDAWPMRMAQLAEGNQNAGLLPHLLGLTGAQRQGPAYKAYERALDHYRLALERVEREASHLARALI